MAIFFCSLQNRVWAAENCDRIYDSSVLANLKIAVVNAKSKKVHFTYGPDNCLPQNIQCHSKSYIIPGDKVLVSKTVGSSSCAFFHGSSDVASGWIENKNLTFNEPPPVSADIDWDGRWFRFDEGKILIERDGGTFTIKGEAVHVKFSFHMGYIDGVLKVDGRKAHYEESFEDEAPSKHCTVEFVRIDDFLVVRDNSNCGGMNMTFSGIYIL